MIFQSFGTIPGKTSKVWKVFPAAEKSHPLHFVGPRNVLGLKCLRVEGCRRNLKAYEMPGLKNQPLTKCVGAQ